MWVTQNKLTGSVSSMPAPNQVLCFGPDNGGDSCNFAGLRALPSADT